MATVAVNPPRTSTVLHRTCTVNISRYVLLASHTFTNTSALTASRTLTNTLSRLRCSLVVTNHRTVSNSATRINPRVTRRLNLPRISCMASVAVGNNRFVIGGRARRNCRILTIPSPYLFAILTSTIRPHCVAIHNVYRYFSGRMHVVAITSVRVTIRGLNLGNSPAHIGHSFTGPLGRTNRICRIAPRRTISLVVTGLGRGFILWLLGSLVEGGCTGVEFWGHVYLCETAQ